jgi:hypothetical protein
MLSEMQVIKRLKELKNYRFVSYHNEFEKGKHIVKLRVMAFIEVPELMHQCDVFFIVTEVPQGLRAVSLNGALHVELLS